MKKNTLVSYILIVIFSLIFSSKYLLNYSNKVNLKSSLSDSSSISSGKSLPSSSSSSSTFSFFKKIENENTSQQENEFNFLKKYPFLNECKTQYNNNSKNDYTESIKRNLSEPVGYHAYEKRILRAFLVYYPIDKISEFQYEFKWLYRSWINIQQYEPQKWRTDLVVFIRNDPKLFENSLLFLNEMNCSFQNIRKSVRDQPMCTLLDFVSISDRNLPKINLKNDSRIKQLQRQTERVVYDFLLEKVDIFKDKESNKNDLNVFYDFLKKHLSNYHYTDSILMAFDGYEYLNNVAKYDFLIRSDMDVFIAPLYAYNFFFLYCFLRFMKKKCQAKIELVSNTDWRVRLLLYFP
jgi:hypothetical protein